MNEPASTRCRERSPGEKSDTGFRIAYAIHAYQKPQQLARLVHRLSGAESGFFIHIDRRKDIAPFQKALRHEPASIIFVERAASAWGTVGEAKMLLNLMAAVLDARVTYDYVVPLSGQDYPIKPNREIISFFAQNRKSSFVYHERMPCSFWGEDGGMSLIERYHIRPFGRRMAYPSIEREEKPDTLKGRAFVAVTNFLCALRFRTPRRFPKYLVPYGGSACLNLTREAVRYVLGFVEEHPDYIRFHRYTGNPSEIFFHTILLNAPENLRGSVVNRNLRYEKWIGTAHPEILTVRDLPELRSANDPFARKFDMDVDSEVLDLLDQDAREES